MALGDYIKTTYVNGAAPGISAERLNRNENKTAELDTAVAAHISDSVYQTAGGTSTAITLIISETLVNGFSITFIASANNNGAVTTINTKPLYKPNTTIAPVLIAGKAYTVWYSSSGNCFFIKANNEGGDNKFPNIIRFGNMTDVKVWGNGGSTSSIANNILTNTGNGSASTPNTAQQIWKRTYTGQKIYIKAKIKVTNSVCLKIDLYTFDGADAVYASSVNNPMQGQEYVLSGICTQVASVNNFYMFIRHIYADNAAANGKSIEISQAMACDLTDTYGAGNEPVKEEIDAIINKFGGWWDNDLSLLTADATATSAHLLSSYKAYTNGALVTGAIPLKGTATYSPSTSTQTISAGQYLSGVQTISAVTGTATADKVDSGYTFSSANGINLTGTSTKKRWAYADVWLGSHNVAPPFTVTGLGFKPSTILVLCETTINSDAYQITSEYSTGIYQSIATLARYKSVTYGDSYTSYQAIIPTWSVGAGTFSFSAGSYGFTSVKYWAFE